jgi:hypothetical protein
MNNIIIPETVPDIDALKNELARQLPADCKIKVPLLNRKCIRVVKSLGIVSEVRVQPKKIMVSNAMPVYLALSIIIFMPFAIYLMFKMKDGEALRSSVYDIVASATSK